MTDKFGLINDSDSDENDSSTKKKMFEIFQKTENSQTIVSSNKIEEKKITPSSSTDLQFSNELQSNVVKPSTSQTILQSDSQNFSQSNQLKKLKKEKNDLTVANIIVSLKQQKNPLLNAIQYNSYRFEDITPDFIMGSSICAVFISLKYHNVYPNYIYDKINSVGKKFSLRILLALVDLQDCHHVLKEMVKICSTADFALMCAWSFEEAGKIIDTYKSFEFKSPESIMEKKLNDKSNYYQCCIDALSSIKKLSKMDAISLLSTFETLENLMKAKPKKLELCPGLGPTKAEFLHDLFTRPLKR